MTGGLIVLLMGCCDLIPHDSTSSRAGRDGGFILRGIMVAAATSREEEELDDKRNRRRPFEKQPKWGIPEDDQQNVTNAFELVSRGYSE